ncbi:hypothetical protein AF335_17400 [Streptomyces eurocidicus]|uniref:Lipoprotein n=1 Tax=Streptomyces eurocidicus TaxID=66423 RepID=A0A2N8NUE1_STREU|nr:hypothetical protein [Streptomyces eurocidicus]MBB5120238.1 hypothetical protein [Streptomyces eurocidicus]MBF6056079.1 hypothetical protein [Streptomyces eurocidicus]PNE32386.1 hypothetical protein AF335_17400 [Streptomyces eurocidicus]
MSVRHVLASALVFAGALTLTACGPEKDTGTSEPSAKPPHSATAQPSAKPSPAKGGGAAGKGSCPSLKPGHKVIWVNNVEGAMNNVIAKDTETACDPSSGAGASYHPVGELKTYALSPDTKFVLITEGGGGKIPGPTAGPGSGVAHVKTCADPDGKQYDGGQRKTKDGEFCWGMNFYDVAVGSDNKITEMAEVYSS